MGDSEISRRAVLRGAGAGPLLAAQSLPLLSPAWAQPGSVDAAIVYARTHLPSSTPEIIRAAAKEGRLTLTLQSFGDDAYVAMIRKFNQRYPFIKVNFTSQGAVPLHGRFHAENSSRRGIGDCFLLSSPHEGDASRRSGSLLPFKISDDGAYPSAAKSSGYWYGWQQNVAVTVFRLGALNAEEIKLVRSYQGLTDPRFKGRLGVANVTNGTSAAQSYYLQRQPQIWRGLAANRPFIKPGSPLLLDGLLSGEYDVALFMGTSTAGNAARDGAPVGFVFSTPAVSGYVASVISAVAPHPNAGKLWQDWALSREGQELWPAVSGAFSVRPDVKAKPWYAKQPWFYSGPQVDIDWNDLTAKKNAVVAQFDATFKKSNAAFR